MTRRGAKARYRPLAGLSLAPGTGADIDDRDPLEALVTNLSRLQLENALLGLCHSHGISRDELVATLVGGGGSGRRDVTQVRFIKKEQVIINELILLPYFHLVVKCGS